MKSVFGAGEDAELGQRDRIAHADRHPGALTRLPCPRRHLGGRPLRAWPSLLRAEVFTGVLGCCCRLHIRQVRPQKPQYAAFEPYKIAPHVVHLSGSRSGAGSGFGCPDRSQQNCVTAQRVERFPVEKTQEHAVAGRSARVLPIRDAPGRSAAMLTMTSRYVEQHRYGVIAAQHLHRIRPRGQVSETVGVRHNQPRAQHPNPLRQTARLVADNAVATRARSAFSGSSSSSSAGLTAKAEW